MLWLWISLIVVGFIIIVLLSQVKVSGSYTFPAGEYNIHLECRVLYGLIRLRFQLSVLQGHGVREPDKPFSDVFNDTIRQWQQWGHRFQQDRELIMKSLKRVTCDHLYWHTRVGTSEASATAIITGTIWGIKSTLIGMFTHLASFTTRPDLQVIPHFNTEHFQTELRFRMRIAMMTIFKVLVMKVMKLWKSKKRSRRFMRKRLAEKT